jgi:hypothetical protein
VLKEELRQQVAGDMVHATFENEAHAPGTVSWMKTE